MTRARNRLDRQRPAVVVGAIKLEGCQAAMLRTIYLRAKRFKSRHFKGGMGFCGANMSLHSYIQASVDGLLALDEIWPSEDRAMQDVLLKNSGIVVKTIALRTMAGYDSPCESSIVERLFLEKQSIAQFVENSHLAEAPPASRVYERPITR